jgi:sec-independent protein translocase protein TatA
MLAMLEGPDLIVVLVVVLVLFGGSQLPKLARNLGQAQREFQKGLADANKDKQSPSPAAPTDNVSVESQALDGSTRPEQ